MERLLHQLLGGGQLEQRSIEGELDSDWWAPTITDVTDQQELWVPNREYMTNYLENTCSSILRNTTEEQRERHMDGGWSMYKTPSEVHRLYDILARSNVQWIDVCMERLDNSRMCRLHDHSLTFLSPQMSETFGIRYWRREFDALPRETVRWYHNEGQISG